MYLTRKQQVRSKSKATPGELCRSASEQRSILGSFVGDRGGQGGGVNFRFARVSQLKGKLKTKNEEVALSICLSLLVPFWPRLRPTDCRQDI